MAMGDSITAGFAMIGYPPTDLVEDRDYVCCNIFRINFKVFSTGGASGAFTLANILKTYSPNIQGASPTWTWPLTKGAWLDAGVSMAKVEDCPSQVSYLVNQLKTTYSKTVDFNNDWKLLTLFIGANNACGACQGRANSKPAYFEQQMDQVLNQIHLTIPKVFVNLVTIFNISGVYYAGEPSEYCRVIHRIWNHECYCVETGLRSDLDAMDSATAAYNQIQDKLAAKYAALNDPGFTVVVQPGLSGIDLPKFPDPLAYLSNLDCFHPSLCANEAFTYQIWNNMMTPAGQKSTTPDLHNLHVKCPTASSYIQ